MIWLVGNKGLLGSEVENALRIRGIDYIATDKNVDITDYQAIDRFIEGKNISWIINCAAYTGVDNAENDAVTAFKLNSDGPALLAGVAKRICAKIIHISTDYVFNGLKNSEYTENDEPHPLSVYGTSKHWGELGVAQQCAEHYIIRTSWLYGQNGTNFVTTIIRLLKSLREIHVVNDQWGVPTYAEDLAETIIQFTFQNPPFGIYHYSGDGRTNWFRFANEIKRYAQGSKIINSDPKIIPISTALYHQRAKRPENCVLDKEKIIKNMHISVYPWTMSLFHFINSIKNNGVPFE